MFNKGIADKEIIRIKLNSMDSEAVRNVSIRSRDILDNFSVTSATRRNLQTQTYFRVPFLSAESWNNSQPLRPAPILLQNEFATLI